MGEAPADFCVQQRQLFPGVVVLAGQLLEAHRIGELRRPVGLVDVEAYSDNAFGYHFSVQNVLYEYAADFAHAHPDVVVPFDPGLYAVLQHVVTYAERGGAGDEQQVSGHEIARPEQNAESEVGSGGGMPAVSTLSAAGRLLVSGDY